MGEGQHGQPLRHQRIGGGEGEDVGRASRSAGARLRTGVPASTSAQPLLPRGLLPSGIAERSAGASSDEPRGLLPRGLLPSGLLPSGLLPSGDDPNGEEPSGLARSGPPWRTAVLARWRAARR